MLETRTQCTSSSIVCAAKSRVWNAGCKDGENAARPSLPVLRVSARMSMQDSARLSGQRYLGRIKVVPAWQGYKKGGSLLHLFHCQGQQVWKARGWITCLYDLMLLVHLFAENPDQDLLGYGYFGEFGTSVILWALPGGASRACRAKGPLLAWQKEVPCAPWQQGRLRSWAELSAELSVVMQAWNMCLAAGMDGISTALRPGALSASVGSQLVQLSCSSLGGCCIATA